MFDIFPIRKFIKLQCLFAWSPAKGISISKLSPILNQIGVFDSHIADAALDKFSSKLQNYFDENLIVGRFHKMFPLRFSVGIALYFFKKKKTKSILLILGPDFGDLLKRFFNTSLFIHKNFKMKYLSSLPMRISKLDLIKLLLFHLCFFNFENFSFYKLIHKSYLVKSVLISYRFRWKMKLRKINFKRKKGRSK